MPENCPSDDPFAALEDAARRQDAEQRGAKAVSAARARLVLGKDAKSAFFATLALRLEVEPCWEIPTAATDGKRLLYNPEWFAALPLQEAIGVMAHEVMHCSNKHMSRRGHREPGRWNIAADLSVNEILAEAGFILPKCRLMPGDPPHQDQPKGLATEEYYNRLPDQPPGDGQDPGGCGGVMDAGDGSQAAAHQAEAEWQVAVAQAANVARQMAKQRGELPAGLRRMIDEVLAPKVDWRDVLREFVSRYARNDYSWSPPNRRFIHQGIYLPGLRSEELGDVVLAVDTSGSIGAKELSRFAGEAQGILDSFDCTLTILYHDAAVCGVEQWTPSDGPLVLSPKGGGGTSHKPVFEWVDRQGLDPACMVCLTDLYSDFPAHPPNYPVLWATVGAGNQKAPWGRQVEVEG